MLNPVNIPHRVRKTVSTLFHHLGIHCATHQKRVILISCVVLTSLFYPALALYSSSNPLAHLSSRFFDTYQSDLQEIWEGHDALRIREDAAARARCGVERTLRIERFLIPSSEWTSTGAATPSTVRFALQLDDRMRSIISDTDSSLTCVRTHDDRCFALSPGFFFDDGIPSESSDVLDTINMRRNITVAGIPVRPSMLLSERSPMDGHHRVFEHIGYLALTYFFHDNDCLTGEGHARWMNTLARLEPDGSGSISVAPLVLQKPRFIALQYDSSSSKPSHFSAITLFLYLSYLIIFVSLSGSLRRMDTVHSRFGLTFTGLIEIIACTIASVSVCALAGFRVTMVPWGILPVIIVFVGAENMFLLVDAVTSTSISLPVKERIGIGLAVAGTSNTLKTVAYNSILGTIAFFASGAIQQFCSFAIVLLVAHWFLVHTFFVAVLSIDLQRLELSDVLSQDKPFKPSAPAITSKLLNESPPSNNRRTMNGIQQLLRGRAAKNGSLVMMLAVTATLYYVTYPVPNRSKDEMDPFPFLKHATAMQRLANPLSDTHSSAWDLWNILNPDHDHLVHVRIETPVIVALNLKESANGASRHKSTDRPTYEPMARRSMRPVWLLKIMILPIGTTTGCLYLLLLYLLKDTELLEAQRNRPDGFSDPVTLSGLHVEGDIRFTTLPRTSATDVELVAANRDGTVIAVVSTTNELFVWKGEYHHLIIPDDLKPDAINSEVGEVSITSVAVDPDAHYCAIGMNTGAVAVWQLTSQGSSGDARTLITDRTSSVKDMLIIPVKPSGTHGSLDKTEDIRPGSYLLVTFDNGSVVCLHLPGESPHRTIHPSHPDDVLRSYILHNSNYEQICVAFTYPDGLVELCSRGNDLVTWESNCVLQAGNPSDPVTELFQEFVDVDGSPTLILAASTRAGVVSLWNPTQRECIFVMGDAFGDITRLRITPMPSYPCRKCGELKPNGFSLSFSVGHMVFVHRALICSVLKRCTCVISSQLFSRDAYGRRSRSGSVSSATSSPMRSRLKNSSTIASLGLPAFPVSGHGAHTRRAVSEKDASRRGSETLGVSGSHQEDLEAISSIRPSSSSGSPNILSLHSDSIWRNLVIEPIMSVNCERGGWDLIDGQQLVGLRRRSRLLHDEPPKINRPPLVTKGGLTASVLERWELWTFDPTKPEDGVRVSNLLEMTPPSSPATTGRSLYPRLPFTRLSSVISRSSILIAGFGNTTGVVDFSRRSRPS